MTNDILRTIDRRQYVVLVLLDLSAAFDTIDHVILVERLESYFGFSKLTLNWFRSYPENRRQSIIIGDQVSTPRALRYGVPQGSLLGPLLFTLYIAPLQDVIARHNLNSLFYADVHSIIYSYRSCKSGTFPDCPSNLHRGRNAMEYPKYAKK